jgi:hypothetical protein
MKRCLKKISHLYSTRERPLFHSGPSGTSCKDGDKSTNKLKTGPVLHRPMSSPVKVLPKIRNLAKNLTRMNHISPRHSIASPVMFNPYKHHLRFLDGKINEWRKKSWAEAEEELRCIGNNLIDLYYGELTVDEICMECVDFATQKNITTPEKLAEWIHPLEYRKTTLSDASVWVIKQGIEDGRFLHVHPAKYSSLTMRVRASTLKTVLAIKITASSPGASELTLHTVNRIRTEKLDLSPVKMLEKGKGIARLWTCFHELT